MTLVLASQSPARRAMLSAAGVPHEAVAPGVDEESAKAALRIDGLDPRNLADALAELKARRVSGRRMTDLVLGCDQVLALDEDSFDKPATREEAAQQLRLLRGRTHKLISAAVICEGGQPVWRAIETATLSVRHFSDHWLDAYLEAEWPAIGGCVGSYRIEAMGAQLFGSISGSYHAVLGLPLLPLLAWLRDRGILTR